VETLKIVSKIHYWVTHYCQTETRYSRFKALVVKQLLLEIEVNSSRLFLMPQKGEVNILPLLTKIEDNNCFGRYTQIFRQNPRNNIAKQSFCSEHRSIQRSKWKVFLLMNFTVQSKFPLSLEKKIKKAVLGGLT